MKKFLVLLTSICCSLSLAMAADEPVQMTAPKPDTVKTVSDADLNSSTPIGQQADSADKAKTDAKNPKNIFFIFAAKKLL